MNIAIFDMQHYEMVNVLHHLFDEDSNNICFFTNDNILSKIKNSELGNKKYDSVVLKESNNISNYLDYCYNYINNNDFDIIIFNTIDKYYKEFSLFIKKLKTPYYLTVHNVNTWLNPPLTFNITALKNYYYRNIIIKKAKAIIVLDDLQKKYIADNKLTEKEIIVIPYCINVGGYTKNTTKKNKLNLAIPGGIDGHRRDIDLIIEIIKEINEPDVEFNFIGNAIGSPGKILLNKILELKAIGYSVNHFYDDNNNSLFETKMIESDIILSPINVNTNYEGIKEIYGITKSTGVIFDMMRFEKPGIVPVNLKTNINIESSIVKYSDKNDLIKIILNIKNDSSFLEKLCFEAKKNALNYNKETIKANILKHLEIYQSN